MSANASDALKLLKLLPSDLYTIPKEGGFPSFVKLPSPSTLQRFLEHCDTTGLNVYFQAAGVKPGVHKKPSKEDLTFVRALFVDLDGNPGTDPDAERKRIGEMLCDDDLPDGVPSPSAYWYTGGGWQAAWILETPINAQDTTAVAEYEAINKTLQEQFYNAKGGGTWNADRLVRLPGTKNWLSPKKVAAGRVPAWAALEEINDNKWKLSDFPKPGATQNGLPPKTTVRASASPDRTGNAASADDVQDAIVKITTLDHYEKLPLRIKWLIINGHPGNRLKEYIDLHGEIPNGRNPDDRSAWVYDVVMQMLRFDCPVGEIVGVLIDPNCHISGHCLDDRDPEHCARRQVARAMATIAREDASDAVIPLGLAEDSLASESSATFENENSDFHSSASNDSGNREKTTSGNVGSSSSGFYPEEEEVPTMSFILDQKTNIPLKCSHNIRVALQVLKVKLQKDTFADQTIIQRNGKREVLQDYHMVRLWFEIESRFATGLAKDKFCDLLLDEAVQNPFHPVKNYFDKLKWDGVKRLDTWLIDYGGAQDSAYVRAVGALPLIAAVRRIKQPGCAFQEILTLVSSKQGTYKSTAIQTLCPEKSWFTDDLPLNAESKEVIERLQGHLLVECAETKGMKRGGDEHVKAFLSRQVDKARMAYGRMVKQSPRQCVFIATSNDEALLRDPTGNRRWWPVTIEKFDTVRLAADRDQLWAEAVHREAKGESIGLATELYEVAGKEQDARTMDHPYTDILARALDNKWGKILAADVWDLIGQQPKTQEGNGHLKVALEKLGWLKDRQRFMGGDPQVCYTRDYTTDDGAFMRGVKGQWVVSVKNKDGRVMAEYHDKTERNEGEHAF